MINDTICAVSTPAGCGGIAVVRVSGPQAIEIVDGVWRGRALGTTPGHTARFGRIVDDRDGSTLDEGVATIFRAPASFTGEDVVELSVHGSVYVQQALLELLCRRGCRLAEAGEFTRRAFAAGKMDLAQAEGVADVIASESAAAHRLAVTQMRGGFSRRLEELRGRLVELASLLELELDFSEEDVEFADRSRLTALAREVKGEVDRLHGSFSLGNAIKNGVPVAIVGAPNVGKSSILNMLLGERRAIVSDIPGTTRDTIEDSVVIGGVTFRFIDTAGLRATDDPIECQGVERAIEALRRARVVVSVEAPGIVADEAYSALLRDAVPADATIIHVLNKADLLAADGQCTAGESADKERVNGSAARIAKNGELFGKAGAGDETVNSLETAEEEEIGSGRGEERILLSAKTGIGADALREALTAASGASAVNAGNILVTNARHAAALAAASDSLASFLDALATSLPTDLAAQDLRQALHHLGAITGAITAPDLLATIFSRFCIGK